MSGTGSYFSYHSIQSTSSINKSLHCSFTSLYHDNLIIVKNNILEVYIVSDANNNKYGLSLLCDYKLFGEIDDIKSFKFNSHSTDSLILSFSDAKVAILEFDILTNSISTVGMYFMDHKKSTSRSYDNVSKTSIYIDPLYRCFAVNIYEHNIAVFPCNILPNEKIINLYPPVYNNNDLNEDIIIVQSHQNINNSYLLELQTLGIKNIKDIIFLEGYLDPSLLVLHEPSPTWQGRYAITNLSCQLTIVSLSLIGSNSHVISRGELLPHDCIKLVTVPLPIGGALVVGSNVIMHFQQNISTGLTLNSFGDEHATTWPLQHTKIKCSLLIPEIEFLSEKEAIVCSNNKMWILSLLTSLEGPALKGMSLVEAAYSPLITSLTIGPNSKNWIFLGSKTSDSMLVYYSKYNLDIDDDKESNYMIDINDDKSVEEKRLFPENEDGESNKKPKLDSEMEIENNNIENSDEQDLLVLYNPKHALIGSLPGFDPEISSTVQMPNCNYNFKIVDMLPSTGNTSSSIVVSSTNESDGPINLQFTDIITSCGVGNHGGICVYQEGIRPEPFVSAELLSSISGCWSLNFPNEELMDMGGALYSSYLLLSSNALQKSILLSSIDSKLEEIESDFFLQGPTLYSGNVIQESRIIQVYKYGIRYLAGTKLIQEISIDSLINSNDNLASSDAYIISANITDPIICLHLSDFSIRVLVAENGGLNKGFNNFNDNNKSSWLQPFEPHAYDEFFVSSSSSNNQANVELLEEKMLFESSLSNIALSHIETESINFENINLNDDDALSALLFGGEGDQSEVFVDSSVVESNLKVEKKESIFFNNKDEKTYVIILARNHLIEFYRLDFVDMAVDLIYSTSNIILGRMLLDNEVGLSSRFADDTNETISEISLFAGNNSQKDNSIFKEQLSTRLSTGEVRIYKAFRSPPSFQSVSGVLQSSKCAPISFRRLQYTKLNRLPKSSQFKVNSELQPSTALDLHIKYFSPFNDIGGRAGICINGWRPTWIFVESGNIWIHSMALPLESSVSCISEFHSPAYPRGYIFFNEKNQFSISALPSNDSTTIASSFPYRKIILGKTIHSLAYHTNSKSLMLSYSVPISCLSINETTERTLPIYADKYGLLMITITQKSWTSESVWEAFDENECITCMHQITLKNPTGASNAPGRVETFVAVGTRTSEVEDVACCGRVIFMDVYLANIVHGDSADAVGNESQKRFQVRYIHSEKRPILTFDSLDGMLALAIGQRVFLYRWLDNELSAYGFLDAQYYITSIKCIKNFIVVGDYLKSIYFYHWEPTLKQMLPLGRDATPQEVLTCGYLIDHNELNIISSDFKKNFQTYQFAPHKPESQGGKNLVVRADFHSGSFINNFFNFRVRNFVMPPNSTHSIDSEHRLDLRELNSIVEQPVSSYRYLCLGVDWNGGFHYILPIDEIVFRRLSSLHTQLTLHLPFLAGLNPRSYRNLKGTDHIAYTPKRNVVDLDLIQLFVMLHEGQQKELAQTIGTSVDQIMDNILDIEISSRVF